MQQHSLLWQASINLSMLPSAVCCPVLAVRLYEYHGWAQKQQVAALDFDNVALEFGGEARCPIRQPSVQPASMHKVQQPTAVA
jgi:hypothetical protein